MLEGHHFQNAYITRDIDKWIAVFRERAKIDFFLQYDGTTPVITPKGPGKMTTRLAFIWVGDMQYELIQPVGDDVEIYSDALPEGDGLKFHHICMRVKDWDEFLSRVKDQPYPVVLESNGFNKFIYLDARPFLGHYLEYVYFSDEQAKQMGFPD